jgi:hypothetical protein
MGTTHFFFVAFCDEATIEDNLLLSISGSGSIIMWCTTYPGPVLVSAGVHFIHRPLRIMQSFCPSQKHIKTHTLSSVSLFLFIFYFTYTMATAPPTEASDVQGQGQSAAQPCDLEIHSSEGTFNTEIDIASQVNRVVCICLDESSGKDAFYWALNQFIQPKSDLVRKEYNKEGGTEGSFSLGHTTSCAPNRYPRRPLYQCCWLLG